MKKLFTLRLHSVVDVITNSSSELFVGKTQSKEEMILLISYLYPDYLKEYEELKNIDDLTIEELENYFDFACSSHYFPHKKSELPILPGFTFEELYEVKNNGELSRYGDVQYQLKNNVINPKNKWNETFVTEENFEEIKNKLDPNREMYFLYSIEENPDWEHQELLMSIMERYHLG